MQIEIGLSVLRWFVGLLLAAHGAQKVFGWFDGPGIQGWEGAMENMGLRPASLWAWLSAGIELLGGLLFALGVLTPIVAGALVVNLLMAIALVHWENGFFNSNGGFEFPLTLAVAALVIGLTGQGTYSLGPQGFVGLDPVVLFTGTLLIGILLLALGLVTRQTAPSREPQPGD